MLVGFVVWVQEKLGHLGCSSKRCGTTGHWSFATPGRSAKRAQKYAGCCPEERLFFACCNIETASLGCSSAVCESPPPILWHSSHYCTACHTRAELSFILPASGLKEQYVNKLEGIFRATWRELMLDVYSWLDAIVQAMCLWVAVDRVLVCACMCDINFADPCSGKQLWQFWTGPAQDDWGIVACTVVIWKAIVC